MGAIQAFFFINYTYSTVVRVIDGILLPSHLPAIVACGMAVLLGGTIAQKLAADWMARWCASSSTS